MGLVRAMLHRFRICWWWRTSRSASGRLVSPRHRALGLIRGGTRCLTPDQLACFLPLSVPMTLVPLVVMPLPAGDVVEMSVGDVVGAVGSLGTAVVLPASDLGRRSAVEVVVGWWPWRS